MNYADYPVTPEQVVQVLRDKGAIDMDNGRHHGTLRFSALASLLKIPDAKLGKFKQQLQDMQNHRLAEFGVEHGSYPTGWRVTLRAIKASGA